MIIYSCISMYIWVQKHICVHTRSTVKELPNGIPYIHCLGSLTLWESGQNCRNEQAICLFGHVRNVPLGNVFPWKSLTIYQSLSVSWPFQWYCWWKQPCTNWCSRLFIPLFIRFYTCQVVLAEFRNHQQGLRSLIGTRSNSRPNPNPAVSTCLDQEPPNWEVCGSGIGSKCRIFGIAENPSSTQARSVGVLSKDCFELL